MTNLFVYGTLMFESVQRVLLGRAVPSRPAQLQGYACYVVRGAVYPGIRGKNGHMVQGLLLSDLHPEELLKLDSYEGSSYNRLPVVVATSAGEEFSTCAYFIAPSSQEQLTEVPWDAERFGREELEEYLQQL